MEKWEDLICMESDDPVVDLDRLVDQLIEQYGLSPDYEETPAIEQSTTH